MKSRRIDDLLASLPKLEAQALLAHLKGGTSARWIAATLTNNGHSVGKTAVNDWRKARV